VRRHFSYEEFAEQYTEYKPPKRYEKKQQGSAADKAAPKLQIMVYLFMIQLAVVKQQQLYIIVLLFSHPD